MGAKTICINCIERTDCVIRKAFTDIHKTFPEIIYTFTLLKCPNHKTIEDEVDEQAPSCDLPDGKERACPACGYMTAERLCPRCNVCVTCSG